MTLRIIEHPLAAHLLGSLRDKRTAPAEFRDLALRLTTILVLEATRDFATRAKTISTPLETAQAVELAKGLAAIPILRAGLGMLGPVTDLFPDVAVGYVGLERDEATAIATSYYCKLPNLAQRVALLLDPMLATGGSAVKACNLLKESGATQIKMICIVAAPEGAQAISDSHPDVEVYSAALDRELDSRKYILPGLGDFGDRLYGTQD